MLSVKCPNNMMIIAVHCSQFRGPKGKKETFMLIYKAVAMYTNEREKCVFMCTREREHVYVQTCRMFFSCMCVCETLVCVGWLSQA